MKRGPHPSHTQEERALRIKNSQGRSKREHLGKQARLDAHAEKMRKDNDEKNVKRRPRKKGNDETQSA